MKVHPHPYLGGLSQGAPWYLWQTLGGPSGGDSDGTFRRRSGDTLWGFSRAPSGHNAGH